MSNHIYIALPDEVDLTRDIMAEWFKMGVRLFQDLNFKSSKNNPNDFKEIHLSYKHERDIRHFGNTDDSKREDKLNVVFGIPAKYNSRTSMLVMEEAK